MDTATEPKVRELEALLEGRVTVTPYDAGGGLPWFITPVAGDTLTTDPAAVGAWYAEHRGAIDRAVETAGAVVLRGFAVPGTDTFNRLVADYPSLAYTGGTTNRRPIAGKAYEATYMPADKVIDLHNEMSYMPNWPSKVAFFCAVAPDTGGETILGRTRDFAAAIPDDFRRAVEEKGILYTRNQRSRERSTGDADLDAYHKKWQEAFETDDRGEVEDACRAMGMGCRWNEADGSLSISYRSDGFTTVPTTGERLWFNQVHVQSILPRQVGQAVYDRYVDFYSSSDMDAPYEVAFGDGTPMDRTTIEQLFDSLEGITVAFPWQSGDVMFLDNYLTMHGRNAYTGSRNVQVALIK